MNDSPPVRTRTLISVAILAAYFGAIVALILGSSTLMMYVWDETGFSLATQMSIGVVFASWILAAALWLAAQSGRQPPEGILLHPGDAPQVYAVCREIAHSAHTKAPDEVWLTGDMNITVVDESTALGVFAGKRRLLIGSMLAAELSWGELEALIAVELARYGRTHSRTAATVYRGASVLQRRVGSGLTSIAGALIRWYYELFMRHALPVLHAQQQRADEFAKQRVGAETLLSALRHAAMLQVAWDLFLEQYLRWGWEAGYRPLGCLSGFRELLAARRELLEDLTDETLDTMLYESDDVWQPYASMQERIDRSDLTAALDGEPAVAATLTPARDNINDLNTYTERVEKLLLDDEHHSVLAWPEFLSRSATASTQEAASKLYIAAGRASGVSEPSLDTVLHLLERGESNKLVHALFSTPEDTDAFDDATEETEEMLADALAAALIHSGAAWWRTAWDKPIELIGPDGEIHPLGNLAERAMMGQVSPAYDHLALYSINPASVRQTTIGGGVGQEWVGMISDVTCDGYSYDLLIHSGGFVLAPLSALEGANTLPGESGRRLDIWVNTLPADAVRTPGATHITHADLLHSSLNPVSGAYTATLLDGRTLTITLANRYAQRGTGAAALNTLTPPS